MVFFEECNVDGHKPVAVGWLNHTRDWDACNESKSLLIFGNVRVPVSESSLLIAQILQGLCLSLWYQPWWDQGLAFIQFHMFNPKNALNSAPQRVPTHTQIFERTCSENWGQSCDQVFMHEFMHKIIVGFKIYEDYFAVAPENSNQNWCPDILHTLCDVSLSLSLTPVFIFELFINLPRRSPEHSYTSPAFLTPSVTRKGLAHWVPGRSLKAWQFLEDQNHEDCGR